MTFKIIKISLILLLCFNIFVSGQNKLSPKDFTVLNNPADAMMRSYLTNLVDRQFSARDSLLSSLKSAKDWDLREQTIRDSMASWAGQFPERTPLNARITGRLEHKDYLIEKILFESRPNFLVSSNLYLPRNFSSPRPAILIVIGHNPEGKANPKYQKLCISEVRKGFVVLIMDAIGQGERKLKVYGDHSLTAAHTGLGIQAFISGTTVFNIMAWDVIRAVDYLVSRPEVDTSKIGITGQSGGGMMSSYILPFEPRISVAVPTCNPGTWSYRVHANLGTDGEQVFFGAFASFIDPRGDPLFCQVPRPLLINATRDDELNPPRGVWDLSSWLFKSYSAHGIPEKFHTSMVKGVHDYNQEQRKVTNAWMLRWAGGDASDFWEGDIAIEKDSELWATSNGSVYNEPKSLKPHELVLDYLTKHKADLRLVETREALKEHKIKMAKLIKSVLHTNLDDIIVKGDLEESRHVGNISVRPFILKPERGIVLPGILLASTQTKGSRKGVLLYINGKGKSAILKDMDIIKDILRDGYQVCAIDLRGFGETSPDMANKFWDFLAGKPIFGQRVRDVLATIKWLKESEIKAQNIKLWGTGLGALYGAFAGVLTDDISQFVLEEPLITFESVVQVKLPKYRHEVLLPNILKKFDMPQIYQALCPRPVAVLNPYLGDKTSAEKSDIEEMNELVSPIYKEMERQKNWYMQKVIGDERDSIIRDVLLKDN